MECSIVFCSILQYCVISVSHGSMSSKANESYLKSVSRISNRATENGLRLGIIGVPFKHGQPKDGVNKGPEALRKAGLIERLKSIQGVIDVKDFGDVCQDTPACDQTMEERQKHVAACSKQLSDKVKEVITDNRLVINLGGDHSLAVGSIHGHCAAKGDGNVGVVWVDAHTDINTPKTSESGNVHGMPLGLLVKEIQNDYKYGSILPGMEWFKPCVSSKEIGFVGLRSVDDYERLFVDKYHIAAYDMFHVDRLGVLTAVKELLRHIDPLNSKSLHVSFDIDVLDPREAPSTGTAVRGGLTLREAVTIMEELHLTGRVGVVDLVEVNPTIGTEEDAKITTEAALSVLETAFGYYRGGTRPSGEL